MALQEAEMKAGLRVGIALLSVVAVRAFAQGVGAASVTILDQTPTYTTFKVKVPDPMVTPVVVDTMLFFKLAIDGANYVTTAPGRPQLLRVPVVLAVPNGSSPSITVQTAPTHIVPVGRVYPEQGEACLNDTNAPFTFDRLYYDTCTAFRPDTFVRPAYTSNWRSLQILNLDVLPVHVNPRQGTICVACSVIVRVNYSGGSVYAGQPEDWMMPLYSRFIHNLSDIALPIIRQDTMDGIKCMVFCHSSYEASDSVRALLQWIRRRGYEDTVVYGTWTDVSLRSAIQAEYQTNPALRWVLLIGEAAEPSQIPMHAYPAPNGNWNPGEMPPDTGPAWSDYYFSCLDDLPSTGALDFYPDVRVARISPRNGTCASLDTIISKILRYQRDPPLTPAWLSTMTFVANKQDRPIVFRDELMKITTMPYYRYWPDVSKFFINGVGAGNSDVTATINSGTGVLVYLGHGEFDRWLWWNGGSGQYDSWHCSEVDALQNGDMTPVVMDVACLCGAINGVGSAKECLSETWLRKAPGGAVASFGAAGTVYNPTVIRCSSLVKALYDCDLTLDAGGLRYNGPTLDLGGVKMYSDAYFVTHGGTGSPQGAASLLRSLVLGDPTMPVWIGGMPESVDVAGLPDSFPVGMETTLVLTVTLKDTSTPVESALVCICGGGTYAVGRTDPAGNVSLVVDINDTTQVSVVVSEGHTNHSTLGLQHTPILPFILGLPEILPRPGWAERAPMPLDRSGKPIRRGGWLSTDSALGSIFAAKGNVTKDFYKYLPNSDSWQRMEEIRKGREMKLPREGCHGAADGLGHVYMVKGYNSLGFWRYDIDDDGGEWHQMPDVPLGASCQKVRAGSDLVYAKVGDTGFVYLLKGNCYDFMRFRIDADSGQWELLDSAPGCLRTWGEGSWLVFDGDHKLYAHKRHYNELWVYDISTGHWESSYRPGMPLGPRKWATGEGSCGAWLDGWIYALKGNDKLEFWRYDPLGDSWHQIEDMPSIGSSGLKRGVRYGADIVSGPRRSLYATKGNKTRELWRYTPSGYPDQEAAGRGVPSGPAVAAGGPGLNEEVPVSDGLTASRPRWNWQGTMVCYSKVDTLTEREQIYQCPYPTASPEQRVVDMDENCEEPVFSPDGEYIAFQLDDTVSGFYQLCVTPATDSALSRGSLRVNKSPVTSAVTSVASDRDKASLPVVKGDVSKSLGTVSASDRQATDAPSTSASQRAIVTWPALRGVAASLGPVWQITSAEEDHRHPEWSPDGEWLCYERDDTNGYTHVWRVPAFGGTEEQLTEGDCDHSLPSYFNSHEIVFTLGPNDDYDQVAKVHDSARQVTVLSTFDTDHDKPSAAWDGSDVVAEAVDDSSNCQIVKMFGPSGETWLTSGTTDITGPDFGQDNQSIFAVRWTGITSQIVRVDADSGGYTAVTDSLAIRDNPDSYVDSFVSNSMAVYEREEWSPGSMFLGGGGGGRRKHGSGVYLSKYRKHHGGGGPQGASLGILALDNAKPNPATSRVAIRWQVPVEAEVSLCVYNTAGQLVKVLADGKCKPGAYTSVWNGTDAKGRRLANGVYFYALDNGAKRISRKVVLTE
jgi:hypothetical protein